MNKNLKEIIRRLDKNYPDAKTDLIHKSPFQLLVAVILSAQCTDERVNIVTKELFKKYKTPEDFINIALEELEKEIYSTGFYKNKAKNIKLMAQTLMDKFNGKVPDRMEDLIILAGVARKTANVVLGSAFGKVEGIVVDTHVIRLSQRLGFTKNTNAEKIEQDLMKIIDKKEWFKFSYDLIQHGRKVCNAKKPLCTKCFLNDICPSVNT